MSDCPKPDPDPTPEPFWPACALCGKPIQTEAEAELIWIGPINAPGGQQCYMHVGRGACLLAKTETLAYGRLP